MRKTAAFAATAALLGALAASPAEAAFVIGGENGWQLSTDGIINVFSTYQSVSPLPGGDRFVSLLNGKDTYDQNFGLRVGLLPSVVGFNVKAPTINGIDSTVRIGIFPNIQNSDSGGRHRFNTNPNIDFREVYYTAKGKYGELLAGRALNLYQGKNILTDMTLLTGGVVGAPSGGTTLGHIGYGYLYTNFGPQIRYTTPDMAGVKVALSVNEPYKISSETSKTPTPRVETEISYATTFGKDAKFQSWLSGMFQTATRDKDADARPGKQNRSIGGAGGAQIGFSGAEFLASGYIGKGLGMISVQDGDEFGSSSTDPGGNERTHFGFLVQATYQLNPDWKIGANYGQTRQLLTDYDRANFGDESIPMKKQEAAVAMVTYNLTKNIQFVGEYTFSQNTWHDHATQSGHSVALGTLFYW